MLMQAQLKLYQHLCFEIASQQVTFKSVFWTQVSASEKICAKDGTSKVSAEAAATLRAPDPGLQAPARPLPPEEPGALGG